MDALNRQKLLCFMIWLVTMLFTLAVFLTSDVKYGYCAVAFAILTHSEDSELRYRRNKQDE